MRSKKKIFIIVGELSGDQIASSIINELCKVCEVELQGIGGNNLKKLGLNSLFPLKEISIMGIFEIIPKVPRLIFLISLTIKKILLFKPDIIITVDAPGFNFRVLKKIKKYKINTKVIHIVAPTVWAWKPNRAKKISFYIDYLLVLFPFEKKYFTPFGIKTYFMGHPLVNSNLKKNYEDVNFFLNNKKIISIFPGSRKKEILSHLNKILIAINKLDDVEKFNIIILAVDDYINLINNIVFKYPIKNQIKVLSNINKLAVFNKSYFSIAVSGTITLELAIKKIPFFTVYKMNYISFFLLKRLVFSKFITLVNIIFKKEIVCELIQGEFNEENIKKNFLILFNNQKVRDYQINHFNKLDSLLTNNGSNPAKYASMIINKIT